MGSFTETMTIPAALFYALMLVESGNKSNAIGPRGEIGPLQMKVIFVVDVNRIMGAPEGEGFSICDALDYKLACEMAEIYLAHYATEERLGHEPTHEDLVRIFHGGPNAWVRRTPEMNDYVQRVMNLYQMQLASKD